MTRLRVSHPRESQTRRQSRLSGEDRNPQWILDTGLRRRDEVLYGLRAYLIIPGCSPDNYPSTSSG